MRFSIIDLGHAQLIEFTSRPTDPILSKGQAEKQSIKLKWPYLMLCKYITSIKTIE